jgi:NAD(P)H dehydrogenase (quinone)
LNILLVAAHGEFDDATRLVCDVVRRVPLAKHHMVTELDLTAEGFQPVMSTAERRAYESGAPLMDDVIARHSALVLEADLLVFVYPTTLSTLPPSLKGWLDRVLVPGVAFSLAPDSNKVLRGLDRVRHIVGISTYDESWFEVKRGNDNGRRTLLRVLRLCAGLRTRTSWVALYEAGGADNTRRQAFLARVERTVGRL